MTSTSSLASSGGQVEAPSSTPAGTAQLRLGTLNLAHFACEAADLAAAILQGSTNHLDVLAVQEVGHHAKDKLNTLAELLRMRVGVIAVADPSHGLCNALLVSEAVFLNSTVHRPCSLICQGRESRAAVAVSLGPNMPHIICTHLDHQDECLRLAQLAQLRVHTQALWGPACTEKMPMVLLGDFNALRRADYSETQWTALVAERAKYGIESETDLTQAIERSVELGGWGWSDCRELAMRGGRTVAGELATSVYGARVDYMWASPAMQRDWAVSEVAHMDVAKMHTSDALTDHALVTCTLGWKGSANVL